MWADQKGLRLNTTVMRKFIYLMTNIAFLRLQSLDFNALSQRFTITETRHQVRILKDFLVIRTYDIYVLYWMSLQIFRQLPLVDWIRMITLCDIVESFITLSLVSFYINFEQTWNKQRQTLLSCWLNVIPNLFTFLLGRWNITCMNKHGCCSIPIPFAN